MKKANRDEGQNISALHPYLKCFFDKSLILYTYENPCELASSVDYPRSRIPQIFPSNKALKNFCRKKVKKRTVFLSKTVLLVADNPDFDTMTPSSKSGVSLLQKRGQTGRAWGQIPNYVNLMGSKQIPQALVLRDSCYSLLSSRLF